MNGVRDRTFKVWFLAAALALLAPCSGYAAGLGKLVVLSTLGQPLNAEIELLSVQKGETITARLASLEVYQQAGAQFNNALTGARVTVERRPSGELYLKATTPRPINEPFLELLIEMNSENGRVVRQYTVLLDPPGYGRAAGEIPPPVTRAPGASPPVAAAPSPAAPSPDASPVPPAAAPTAEGPLPAPRAASPARARQTPALSAAAGREYGPVKPGETLRGIARNVRPDGVSLEQTLVGLYRHNPEAFIKKNMNLVRSGKILRVPEAEQMSALPQSEAVQEVRMQVADFNAYRNLLASRPATAPEEGSVRSGRIGSRVTDRGASEEPRDTVRISRGEPAGKGTGAAGMNTAERLRALEEEVIAREKALAEANARIAHLEQIIKDTQRAMELKSATSAAALKGAEKGASSPQPGGAVAVAPPATPPAEPQREASAATEGAAPTSSAPAAETGKGPAVDPPAAAAKAEPPSEARAKAAPVPEPTAEPGLLASLLDEPLYLAAGGAAVLLGGLGLMIARRRRNAEQGSDVESSLKVAPRLGDAPPGTADGEWGGSVLERTAARGDTGIAPTREARLATPPPETSSSGAATTRRSSSAADDNDLDFNVAGGGAGPAKAARSLDAMLPRATDPGSPARQSAAEEVEPPRTGDVGAPRAQPQAAEPFASDFASDTSRAGPNAGQDRAAEAPDSQVDFDLEPLPPVGRFSDTEKVSSEPPPNVDFKLDLDDLDVNAPARPGAAVERDDHWYDVQQKFDLAKAYEEMGDKNGARDILQEVIREGDESQQAQAKKLIQSLG